MSIDQSALKAIQHLAKTNRARLRQRIAQTRTRLAPARLVSDATESAKMRVGAAANQAMEPVRNHPVLAATAVGVGVAGLAAWIFRKPLMREIGPLADRAWQWLESHVPLSLHSADDAPGEDSNERVRDDYDRAADHHRQDD